MSFRPWLVVEVDAASQPVAFAERRGFYPAVFVRLYTFKCARRTLLCSQQELARISGLYLRIARDLVAAPGSGGGGGSSHQRRSH
jgi:hypothetical protein